MSLRDALVEGSWLCRALLPAAWVYGRVVERRRASRSTAAVRLDSPVISVGNITCGGTGKTPAVEMVARDLLRLGRKPAILSRGYGSRTEPGSNGERHNDEYRVLRQNLPEVPHLQGKDRVAIGRRAVAEGADVLVLDDGFQHVRLHRDLDIVLIDALSPFGGGRVLPAGLLREPLASLRYAGLLGITRSDLAPPLHVERLSAYLRARCRGVPQMRLVSRPVAWHRLAGDTAPAEALRGRRVVAFCGIGNPEAFWRQLVAAGLQLESAMRFPDHHDYSAADVARIDEEARRTGVETVVMTQKDAVKLQAVGTAAAWWWLRIESRIERGSEEYERALLETLEGGRSHAR